jgi:uncharacterized protein (TIGR00369 family)
MPTFLERIQKMMADPDALPPVARLVGFRVAAVEVGGVTLEIDTSERHHNAVGTLHGGILCDVADAAMGLAYATTLPKGESFTTVELKINYLRPVWKSRLRVVGRVVKGGRTLGLTEADVFDAQGRLVARASSTCMTLRGESAANR